MLVTGKYEMIGLMAYPIRHSLSPEMQNRALEKMGVPMVYVAFEVDNNSLEDAIKGLKALKMRGSGVSMPNKQLVTKYIDELSPAAKLVGAINTIVNDNGLLKGYNTDGTGHIRAIKETGFNVKGKKMVLAGAGGAGTAIGAQAAVEGVREISLFNRQDEFFPKAIDFAKRVNDNTECKVNVYDLADQKKMREEIESADFLSNGTSAGMAPATESCIISDKSMLRPSLLVSESVYKPLDTKLVKMAKEVGCTTVDGYGMLLWQGAEQFKMWTGKDFPIEYIKETMGFK